MKYDAIIIGAGLTGLSTAFFMKKRGFNILVLEKSKRIGGAMQSHTEDGFVFEEGPNTGVIGNTEVAELLESLDLEPEIANKEAEKRLILKKNKWYALPSGAVSFFKTPLFSFSDKCKMMFEPFIKKGNNPEESVASLASRRIGQSFVDYAVNPFISGIYAGDPKRLITKYALPKLYNLEQSYGSFIGGAIKKSRKLKSEQDKKATRKVFSEPGGFSTLIHKLEKAIGTENIICNAIDLKVCPQKEGYDVSYLLDELKYIEQAKNVITTIGAFALPEVLPFVNEDSMSVISNVNYAKVVQIAVGVKKEAIHPQYISFGGLIPQKENRRLLGVLFPSFCFENRSPDNFSTLAIYMGGVNHPEYIDKTDEELQKIVREELLELFQLSESSIYFMKIFKHKHAIPQYEKSSGKRFQEIENLQFKYKGLIIGGNLRDGIGIADRVKQAYTIAQSIS